MKYLVTGADDKLAGRVANNTLEAVAGTDLIFTCPNLARVPMEKKTAWEEKGVTVKEANYDDVEQMTKAFEGADRLFFISSIINGPKRVEQHRKVIEACKKAGVKHITYTSFLVQTEKAITSMCCQIIEPQRKCSKKAALNTIL